MIGRISFGFAVSCDFYHFCDIDISDLQSRMIMIIFVIMMPDILCNIGFSDFPICMIFHYLFDIDISDVLCDVDISNLQSSVIRKISVIIRF